MNRVLIASLLLICVMLPVSVVAHEYEGPLTAQYNINVETLNLGADNWRFTYTVTNIAEGDGTLSGLDGLYVMVPNMAVISNVHAPAPYIDANGASWITGFDVIPNPNYQWIRFWGCHPNSVYPVGTSAVFSFDAANVLVGSNEGLVVSYFFNDPYNYHTYSSQITGPVCNSVPEPATMLLLGLGLAGLSMIRRNP